MHSMNQNQTATSYSRFGIASFIIANIFGGAFFIVALLTTVFKSSVPEWRSYPAAIMMLGSLMLLCCLACIIGLVLGILAFREANRKKTLVVIGLIVNGLVVLFLLAMLITMNLLGTIIENYFLAWAYSLTAMLIGFTVLYFTYIRKAKLSWKKLLQGFVITWAIIAFPILLFGENALSYGTLTLSIIIIGFIVFYIMRRSSEKSRSNPDKAVSTTLSE